MTERLNQGETSVNLNDYRKRQLRNLHVVETVKLQEKR